MSTGNSNQKDKSNELYKLLANENFTGFYDDNKQPILVGDKLKSEWGYEVIVVKDVDGYSGKLVCDENHNCKNIPYALNEGKGHSKIICG